MMCTATLTPKDAAPKPLINYGGRYGARKGRGEAEETRVVIKWGEGGESF